MTSRVASPSFERKCLTVPIGSITMFRNAKIGRHATKYGQILASIKEIGLVEAPVIFPLVDNPGQFGLLDGHLRIQALKELDKTEVTCLVATADDTYTYNRQINRLSPAQDAKMIAAAIKQGVPEERIAAALNLTPNAFYRRKTLLDGLCAEARAVLAAKDCARAIFEILKRMKPMRQIDACEMMVGHNNFSPSFLRAIFAATPLEQLVTPRRKPLAAGSIEHMAKLEQELATLQEQTRTVEASYGPDVLRFTVINQYVTDIIARPTIASLLKRRYPDIFKQFEKMALMSSLPDSVSRN